MRKQSKFNTSPEYQLIGPPVIVHQESAPVKEIRLNWTRGKSESENHLDLRRFVTYADGTAIPSKDGLRLTMEEVIALRDALDALEL